MIEIATLGGRKSDGTAPSAPDGRNSWIRLALALTLATVVGLGMWCVVVILPAVQAEFGISRGQASSGRRVATSG